jgi:hypothetical protein
MENFKLRASRIVADTLNLRIFAASTCGENALTMFSIGRRLSCQ